MVNWFITLKRKNQQLEKKTLTELNSITKNMMKGGDYFVPLPTNIKPIIDSLNSLDERRVQTVINSLALATKENFENWLQNLK